MNYKLYEWIGYFIVLSGLILQLVTESNTYYISLVIMFVGCIICFSAFIFRKIKCKKEG